MLTRILLVLLAAGAGTILLSACGGDDGNSTLTPSASATATAAQSVTPTPGPAMVTASPGRQLPPADHVGLHVLDLLTFMRANVGDGAPTPKFCAGIDLQTGIIDCVEAGYGTIAVDPIPQAQPGELSCRVLVDPKGKLFAASCTGATGAAFFIYGIQS